MVNLFFLFALNVGKKPKVDNHLCSRHVVSQGPQVSCRVSGSSSVGTWAAAVLWLSFPVSWMWNDSLSDADCYTSRISYPWKQMLVSHRGLLLWQKQHEDVWREVWAQRLKLHRNRHETQNKPSLSQVYSSVITLYAFFLHVDWASGHADHLLEEVSLVFWCETWRTECRATSSLFSSV